MSKILRKIDLVLLLLLISGCSATIETKTKQKETLKDSYHYVRQGENLFRISMYYYEGASTKEVLEGVEKIKNANNIKTNSISVGQRLIIPQTAKKQPNYPLLPPSDITTTIKSSTGSVSTSTTKETKIEQPITSEYRPILIDRAFIWPVSGKIICNFGELDNQGIDILVEPGIDVLSADDGKIVFAGITSKYQETIIIEHSSSIYTVYSHDLDLLVQQGDYVRKGTPIAKVKSGTHRTRYIHFEIRINNVAVNPLVYLPQQ